MERGILSKKHRTAEWLALKKCEFFRLVRVPFFLQKGGTFYENKI